MNATQNLQIIPSFRDISKKDLILMESKCEENLLHELLRERGQGEHY